MNRTVIVGIILILVISVITGVIVTHLPNQVPIPSNSSLGGNLNVTTLVPGIYAHEEVVCLVYFRPFQTATIDGERYVPVNQGPPNGVFKLQNSTPLILGKNITIELVIDNVPQNVTLPVFLEPVGIQPHAILVLNASKS